MDTIALHDELEKVLGKYTAEPLSFCGLDYGELYISEKNKYNTVSITDEGKALCGRHLELLSDCVLRKPGYVAARKFVASGESGKASVYKLALGGDEIAVKEHKVVNDHDQLQRYSEARLVIRDFENVTVPTAFFSHTGCGGPFGSIMAMEYVDGARDLESIRIESQSKYDELYIAMMESGAPLKLLEAGIEVPKPDDVMVKRDERTGAPKFSIVDL
ncbi:MAG: hypothetical protein ABIA12_02615 [Candidatus Aenigmatarchaeota archaeon]